MKKQSQLILASPKKKYTLLTSQNRVFSGQKRWQNSALRSRQIAQATLGLKTQGSELMKERLNSQTKERKQLIQTGKSAKGSGIKKINEPTEKIVIRIRQNIRLLAAKMQDLFEQEIQDDLQTQIVQNKEQIQKQEAFKVKKTRSLEQKGNLTDQNSKKEWHQHL